MSLSSYVLALAAAVAPPPAPPLPTPPPAPPAPANYILSTDPSGGQMFVPFYPVEENCRSIGGVSRLLFHYDEHGDVQEVDLAHSSGNRNLDRAAIEGAIAWEIVPGKLASSGQPVAGKAYINVEFVPEPDESCEQPVRLKLVRLRHATDVESAAAQRNDPRANVMAASESFVAEVEYYLNDEQAGHRLSVAVDHGDELGATQLAPAADQSPRTVAFLIPAPKRGWRSGWKSGAHRIRFYADGVHVGGTNFRVS